jgi:hypothetical protein
MAQRNGLMLANDLQQSDAQRQHVCGACGRIMILGHNSTLKIQNVRELRPKRKDDHQKSSTPKGPIKVLSCHNCGRYTEVRIPPPAPISRKKPLVMVSTKTDVAKQQPASASASSKKRAKNRKAGLQALLNQSQAGRSSTTSGLGLSLSDFMKK